ncbi:Uncharacterized protein dnl_05020 [Desulfonema limicola]|uniref:FeS-binding protein n=1 Tax=Desulfonema limicola TaxID=45656 RepID=A0A975GEJ6_9BACT|nr:hypothetical protein [Desulfonema limicola]QTA78282.1 Uncharacterized protein dnl_05020 [Desulfonema limicola]
MKNKGLASFYSILIFFLALTGFAQMPIFKRYYIADIPGLGWLDRFYITHYMHYIGAIIFFAFSAYMIVSYIMEKKTRITISGYIRLAILEAIAVTGILLVLRNFPGYIFAPNFIIFLNFAHLGLVMVLLFVSLYCVSFKKKWVLEKY